MCMFYVQSDWNNSPSEWGFMFLVIFNTIFSNQEIKHFYFQQWQWGRMLSCLMRGFSCQDGGYIETWYTICIERGINVLTHELLINLKIKIPPLIPDVDPNVDLLNNLCSFCTFVLFVPCTLYFLYLFISMLFFNSRNLHIKVKNWIEKFISAPNLQGIIPYSDF